MTFAGLDRGEFGFDLTALGFQLPDAAGERGRIDAGLDDRAHAALQLAALVAGVTRQAPAFFIIGGDVFGEVVCTENLIELMT